MNRRVSLTSMFFAPFEVIDNVFTPLPNRFDIERGY